MSEIRTVSRPFCPVCQSMGLPLYDNMKDELFGSAGSWDVKRCASTTCGTLWLDPAPAEDALPQLYEHYSTHTDDAPLHITPLSFFQRVRESYLRKKLGYPYTSSLVWMLAYLHPTWRDTQEANVFYIPHHKNGKLLDIGCGAGGAMQVLEHMGWETTGIDFDEKAVENAKQKGLDAHVGDVLSHHFDNDSFDAILMNHVIEHVPHPKETIAECFRILKHGGTLVVLTPNSKSRGHSCYGKYWRGLEIPQHLQIFSVASLSQVAYNAGFTNVRSFSSTQGILNIYDASHARATTGSFNISPIISLPQKILYHLRWFFFGLRRLVIPNKDEVAVIVCQK